MSATSIYVMAVRNGQEISGPVKVGITSNPGLRLAQFQTACPYEMLIVRTFQAPDREIAREIEKCFHATQREHLLRGEWFNLQPNIACGILAFQIRMAISAFSGLEERELETAYELAGVS